MKNLILSLALLAVASAHAAAPLIVKIDDTLQTTINGEAYGLAGDVIVNHRTNAPLVVAVNQALAARLTQQRVELAARLKFEQESAAAAIAAKEAEKLAAIAAKEAEKLAEIAAAAAAHATARAALEKATAAAHADAEKPRALLATLQAADPATLPPAVRTALAAVLQSEDEREMAQLSARKAAIEERRAKAKKK